MRSHVDYHACINSKFKKFDIGAFYEDKSYVVYITKSAVYMTDNQQHNLAEVLITNCQGSILTSVPYQEFHMSRLIHYFLLSFPKKNQPDSLGPKYFAFLFFSTPLLAPKL